MTQELYEVTQSDIDDSTDVAGFVNPSTVAFGGGGGTTFTADVASATGHTDTSALVCFGSVGKQKSGH